VKKERLLIRCIVQVAGLFIMALGVALSVKADLGTSPISSVPYVYSLGFPFTMGVSTVAINVIFILLQLVVLKKEFQPIQLLQLPVAIMFGFFTDVTLSLVSSNLLASNYFFQWILCLLGCLTIAFGVYLQVKAKVIYLAGDGLVLAICTTFHKEFGKVKVGFDCTLVVIGIISSLVLLHSLHGIREGTIVAALLVGTTVRFYSKKLKFVDALLGACATGEQAHESP
jgi:uncharacterized membrane protein YczE